MSVSHNGPCTEVCPLQHAMEMIGGKWKQPIRVEYQTTDKAKSLTPILVQLAQWAVSADV